MEKKKEIPWTDRKTMYKDGDPDIFRKFTWLTWKNMTEGERAMWTELSSAARAPIPKETIEFERTVKAANKPDALADPVSLKEWEAKHNDEAKAAHNDEAKAAHNDEAKAANKPEASTVTEFKKDLKERTDKMRGLDAETVKEKEAKQAKDFYIGAVSENSDKFAEVKIDEVRAELKERGIKFAYNSKLETLQKKLADADNPE